MPVLDTVIYDTREAVAYVTLNRPAKRNAINDALLADLKTALRLAEQDGAVKVIVVRGAGKDFCAGLDLAQLGKIAQASVAENLADATSFGELFLQMRRCAKPLLAAVQGRAYAGGAGIASACDLILAAHSAQFCYTETRLGFVPAIVLALARRNMSEKRAFELLTMAKPFDATEAEHIGLVNRVCADDEFESVLASYANDLASLSGSAVAMTKALLYQNDGLTFDQAIQAGINMNTLARLTPDCQNGIQQFLAKQK